MPNTNLLAGSIQPNVYYVGIGEIKLGKIGEFLRISALGSCIGLILYPQDNQEPSAIMAHIMLPDSESHVIRKNVLKSVWPMSRFADIAIPKMIQQLTDTTGKYDVKVNLTGGGYAGQAEALRLGIARALVKIDPEFRPALKEKGLMRRDPRMVERKKPGQPKARKKFQFSKR